MYNYTREGLLQVHKALVKDEYVGNPELARLLRNYVICLKEGSNTPLIYEWLKDKGRELQLTQVSDYFDLIYIITFNHDKLYAEFEQTEWEKEGVVLVRYEDGRWGHMEEPLLRYC